MKNHKITIGRIALCMFIPFMVAVIAVGFTPILMYVCFRKEMVFRDGKNMELHTQKKNSSQGKNWTENKAFFNRN